MNKNIFLDLYKHAYNNAIDLLDSAEILFDKKHYPHAYFLAHSALEEISKSQFAADVFTGYISEKEFRKKYLNHEKKLASISWAYHESSEYQHNPERTELEQLSFEKRQKALYTDLDFKSKTIKTPTESIDEKDVKDLIDIVNTALSVIFTRTECLGLTVGTKGFLK